MQAFDRPHESPKRSRGAQLRAYSSTVARLTSRIGLTDSSEACSCSIVTPNSSIQASHQCLVYRVRLRKSCTRPRYHLTYALKYGQQVSRTALLHTLFESPRQVFSPLPLLQHEGGRRRRRVLAFTVNETFCISDCVRLPQRALRCIRWRQGTESGTAPTTSR